MNYFKIILFAFVFVSLLFSTSEAQEDKRNIGISIGIQDLNFDFNIPIFLSEKMSIVPALGIISTSGNATDVDYGCSFRFYANNNKLSPFWGLRIGGMTLFPKSGASITDLLFGGFFGAEYNIDKNFSIGGELQLNATSSNENSNRFGNPGGTNVNTGSFLFVTFYFD